MNKYIYISIILILLNLTSCSNNNTKSFNYERLGSGEVFSNKIINGTELIYLDNNLDKFSRDLILEKGNDNYYLLDTKFNQVIVTDTLGKIIKKIEKDSNIDYQFIKDITHDNAGNLYLLCNESDKILVLDPSYNLISTQELPTHSLSFATLGDNFVFFKDRYQDTESGTNTIIVTDNSFSPKRKSIQMVESKITKAYEDNLSSVNGEYLFFKHFLNDSIYKIYPYTHILAYTINYGKYKYPIELIKATNLDQIKAVTSSKTVAGINRGYENDNYLVLLFTEEGLENNITYLIYDKKADKTYSQKFNAMDIEVQCLGAPIALTENDEIIFTPDALQLHRLMTSNPTFKNMNIKGDGFYALLKVKLK